MDTNGNFSSTLRFYGSMNDALSGVKGADAERVMEALGSVPTGSLSGTERQAALALTRELARDGNLTRGEADELCALLSAFSGHGSSHHGCHGPFHRGELGRYSGNVRFAQLVGQLASLIGGRAGDRLFQAAANQLLQGVCQNFASEAVSYAFRNANLCDLNSSEKSTLLTMLGIATGNGNISIQEARALLTQLDRFLGTPRFEHCCQPPQCGDLKIESQGCGKASIDLGDGYSLKLNEGSSELVLVNSKTCSTTRIWGDPHCDFNGKRLGDFYGTTTLVLDNGAKITIETVPWGNNKDAFLSSKLTITKGDQLITVSGLDENVKGDLNVQKFNHGGYAADCRVQDGLRLYEDTCGGGWIVRDGCCGHKVTQEDFDTTKPGALINSGEYDKLALAFAAKLIGLEFSLNLLSSLFSNAVDSGRHTHGHYHSRAIRA